eukprot:1034486_1
MMQGFINKLKGVDVIDLTDPSTTKLYVYSITTGCGVFISIYLYTRRAKPNDTIPLVTDDYQPFFFGHYFWLTKLRNNVYKDYEEAFDSIYPLKSKIIQFASAFSSNHIYILDPQLMQTVFGVQYYKHLEPQHNIHNKHVYGELLGNGFLTYKNCNNTRYILQQQLIKQNISNNNVQQYMFDCTNYHSKQLVIKVEELRNDGNRIDIHALTECFLFDLFMNVYTGVHFQCIQLYPKALKFHHAFTNIIQSMKKRNNYYALQRMFGFGEEQTIKRHLDVIHQSITSLIYIKQMKLESMNDQTHPCSSDFLSALLCDKSEANIGVTDMDIRDIIINMLYSSIETTKLLIVWTLYELSRHPSILKQVNAEVNVFLQNEREINMENINDDAHNYFVLLDGCLCETLRLHPPICQRKYRVNKRISFTCGDSEYRMNKNEEVIINGYIYGRLHSIWGEDALKFNPNRFRNRNIIPNEPSFEYIPFGVEPGRSCFGKYIALMVAKVMIVEILRKYDYQSVDIQNTTYFMDDDRLRMKNPFLIKVHRITAFSPQEYDKFCSIAQKK